MVVVRLVVVVWKGWIRKGAERRYGGGGAGRHRDGSGVRMYAYCMYKLGSYAYGMYAHWCVLAF